MLTMDDLDFDSRAGLIAYWEWQLELGLEDEERGTEQWELNMRASRATLQQLREANGPTEPQVPPDHPPGIAELDDLAITMQAERRARYDAAYAEAQARVAQEQRKPSPELVEAVRKLLGGFRGATVVEAAMLIGSEFSWAKPSAAPRWEAALAEVSRADPQDLQAAIEIVLAERGQTDGPEAE